MRLLILDDDQIRHNHFKKLYSEENITHVYTAEETINTLKSEEPFDYIFLDHDLGGQQMVESGKGTGYEVAQWIADNPECLPNNQIVIHSLNPWGRENMKHALYKVTRDITDAPGCWKQ